MKYRVTPTKIDTEKLIAIRRQRDMSKEEVAAKAGYTERHLSNLENGTAGVSRRFIKRICEVLDIEFSDIEIREKRRVS